MCVLPYTIFKNALFTKLNTFPFLQMVYREQEKYEMHEYSFVHLCMDNEKWIKITKSFNLLI